jgi:flagellar assembly protein FliH
MGRVVKGAQIVQQTYQVKAPVNSAQPEPAVAFFDEDPLFQVVRQPEAEPAIDVEAVRAEAAQILADASDQAEKMLADARERALKIIDDAERGVAEIEANAKNAGFDQGVTDGRAAAQAEMDEMLDTMRGLIEMARAERHKIIESAEPEIVRLSVAIAERILNGHIAQQPETVMDIVRSAITRLVNRETVTVRVNPADIELMREHRDRLMALNDIDNLRVIEDQRVDRGGVVVDTDAGTIDAKISTQLREVRRLLAVEPAS